MKKIFTILIISILFAGEMEVDGNLNVSGDIQSPTIAQLQEIIAQLQAEIAALQAQIASMQDADNKLETRVFEFNNIEILGTQNELDIRSALSDYNLDNILIGVYDFDSFGQDDFSFRLMVSSESGTNTEGSFLYVESRENYSGLTITKGKNIPFDLTSDDFIYIDQQSYWGSGSPPFYGNLKLAITASFPSESNVQRKDKAKVK